ncbi:MAG TPA: TolC family outer membrane protein [Pseudomonadales bacterium]|nr:TolC family outer membrane protein [Pseudomonadales bacterium]
MWRFLRAGLVASACAVLIYPASAETLQEVYQLARQNDALLKAQEASAAAGRETGNIYKSALLPQAELGASKVKSDTDLRGVRCSRLTGNCNNVDTDTTRTAVSVSQALLNMEAWYDFQQGKKLSEQADAQYRSDEMELLVRVTQAYVGVLRAIDNYQTALAQEKAIERQLEQTRQRFDVGLIAITDVQESQATYDSAHVETLSALGNIGIAFEAVEVLTGQPLEKIAPLADGLPVKMPQPETQAEWERLALENNPDLAVSALSVDAARENAKARKAAHLPTIYGSFEHSNEDNEIDYNPGSANDDQNGNVIALNLRIPLYSGGGISASRRQAYQQQLAAEETFTNNQRNAVQGARSYYLAVSTDIQRVAAQQQAIVSAKSALDATQAGYEVGTRNIVDVLDAEQSLYRAKFLYANARYQYILNMLRLLQTAGTLSDDNVLKLNQWLQPEKSYSRSQFH